MTRYWTIYANCCEERSSIIHDPHTIAAREPYRLVFFGDRIIDFDAARVPVTTHALHYGTAVFEGIRAYGDGTEAWLFRAHDHYERLLHHARLLEFDTPYDADAMVQITVELLRRNEALGDTYIRPLLFGNSPRLGAGLWPEAQLAVYALPMVQSDAPRSPVRAMISRWRRFPADCCPSGAKISGLYVNSSLARADALAAGYDQPILLTTRGDVAEGYGANIFAVTGGRVVTPPADADILAGFTRQALLDYFHSRDDLTAVEDSIMPEDLLSADELFFCGTGMEITPIGSLGESNIGNGTAGTVTTAAGQWYRNLVTGRVPCPPGWRIGVHSDL